MSNLAHHINELVHAELRIESLVKPLNDRLGDEYKIEWDSNDKTFYLREGDSRKRVLITDTTLMRLSAVNDMTLYQMVEGRFNE